MKGLSWILAGVGAGVAVAYVLMNQQQPQPDTGWNSVEGAAGKTWGWGSKTRLSGAGTNLGGKLKEGVGRLVGDRNLADEGTADRAAGAVKNAVGTAAQAAGETLHDLNR